ncbi:acyl-homoserine-lactone synthase [Zavarzinia compransoris]|uniref:Acyl-homoserine-lactone synthase n=1 Tax=Zavarzinia compransoris TaxID=1264899 RepID=A0A317DXF5_9PROT|nr:acyl-homoserine-lactone synthase [Zavarzinia compransoris]PWR19044.1 autoinducer synthase [Zavarzinia compransoris]TDP49051.1 acyl-homoserine lactone synthase [Zavarzinia compransoris]
MIDVIGPWNRMHHQAALDTMFRLRHQVFVEEMGWDLPMARDGMERDQFDGPRTVYLVCRDDAGTIQGSMRLIPTSEPHVLCDIFPELCDGPVPRGPAIYESSRSCISRAARRNDPHGTVWGSLTCAMIEFAMLRDLDFITAVMERRMVDMARAADWHLNVLGPEVQLAGGGVVAVTMPIDGHALATVRRQRRVPDTVLSFRFAAAA